MNQRSYKAVCVNERKWVLSLFVVLLSVAFLYMYFVTTSVVQVVMRQEIERDITDVSARISELESEYIKAQHEISADIASHEGYLEIEEKIFISRTPSTLVLSLGESE